jgi:hypothetical protein
MSTTAEGKNTIVKNVLNNANSHCNHRRNCLRILVGPGANLKVIGDIFIRLIQMSVVLLVMTAVSAAIGNVDGKSAGKMGFHTFKWIIILQLLLHF